ncbi:GroES-like protein [Marasmius fiardii PR-910]|nr:GroES-like protein [Marasmius fiardii PR-910]
MSTSIPSEQKAIAVLKSKGEYTLITSSVPKPRSGEVLVKLEGAALNHLEWKLPHAPYEIVPYPLHSGTDGAGTVVSVGEGVSKLNEGDRILFQGWFDAERSTFQEYAVVNQYLCAKIPKTLDFLHASSIPLALITSAFGLCLPNQASPSPTFAAKNFKSPPRGGAGLRRFWEHGAKESYSNEPIVILGGSSSVGQFGMIPLCPVGRDGREPPISLDMKTGNSVIRLPKT